MTTLASTVALDPPVAILLPFLGLLLAIALLPSFLKHHWEGHYHVISVGFGAITVAYYAGVLRAWGALLGVAEDYLSFIIITGSFFIIASGIHLRVKAVGRPTANCAFLALGALLGGFIGATGASMLLIRPWIHMNKYRFTGLHLAFFTFIVSNFGGGLSPVGPPLLLGYLKGVPFWWGVVRCWPGWCTTTISVLGVFYLLDRLNYQRVPTEVRDNLGGGVREWRVFGIGNILLLVTAVVSVIALPSGFREGVLIGVAVVSFFATSKHVHEMNDFTFAPMKEIAWLFLGIFATMKPVLDYMVNHAGDLGLHSDVQFYWMSGILSGVLDNAPTYLTFLATAFGLEHLNPDRAADMQELVRNHDHYLVAVSLGSTCFGALTYLGNGPNLMVKAIAEHANVKTPGFCEYVVRFSAPVLLPVFAVVAWIFLRH